MDNPVTAQWSTAPGVLVAAGSAAVAGGVLVVLTDDAPGRLLLGVATAGLLVLTGLGVLLRPRLSADGGGLRLRGVRGARTLPWAEVTGLEVATARRLGRAVHTLEITTVDDPDGLVVLTALDLGADPRDVHAALLALRAG